jgi:DNA polymerase-1
MKNLVIDGGNLLYRTFFSSQNTHMVNSTGYDVAHILHFLKNIKSYVDKYKSDRIFVCWDVRNPDFTNFRQAAVEYKQQRDSDIKVKVHRCDKVLMALCGLLGVQSILSNKLEADDAVAWLCLRELQGQDITLISADKDFLQLMYLCPKLTIYSPVKSKTIKHNNFNEYSDDVNMNRYLLYKAIVGDTSDNITGLKGYGPKRGKIFVDDFKDKFKKLKHAEQMIVERNVMIMDLRVGLKTYPDEVAYYESQLVDSKKDMDVFFEFCSKLEIQPINTGETFWRKSFNKLETTCALQSLLNG